MASWPEHCHVQFRLRRLTASAWMNWRGLPVTFLVLVATFIGCSCLVVPLLLLAAFALFDRDAAEPESPGSAPSTVTRTGG